MQGLVYIFIALSALGVAGAAYFGFTFTPIEAVVTALCFGVVCVVLVERQLRRRSEARLERAIEDLARLLSTDAQAGQVLSQRINQLADHNAGSRLEGIEADISVLGTVVRQVAEAVAEIEERHRKASGSPTTAATVADAKPVDDEDALPEPVIPIEMLKQALGDDRLVFHIDPIVQLPQRRPFAYDLLPRLALEDGDFADAADFLPRSGHPDIVRRIEALALEEAITVARRARTGGSPIKLFLPLSPLTLGEPASVDQLMAVLDANRAISSSLGFAIAQHHFRQLMPTEKMVLAQMYRLGISFSMTQASSLRFDFSELQGLGFQSVRVDATRFLRDPLQFTDFHAADVPPYARRYHVDIVASGLIDEQQLLTLFEDGVTLVQGRHIARPGPIRADLAIEREPARRRAEV